MKNLFVVPVWLREYLGSRGLSYDVLKDGTLGDILSGDDVISYRLAAQAARSVDDSTNPIKVIPRCLSGFFQLDEKEEYEPKDWLLSVAGTQAFDNPGLVDLYLFYYAMIEGPSVTGIARRESQETVLSKVRKIDFDFEVVGDIMVVVAKYNDKIDNRSDGYRAELLSKCVEKMHLFMSFEEIAGTEIFAAYIRYVGQENKFVRNDAGLPDRS